MKKNFTTGLAILLPIVITFLLINYLLTILTAPFHGLIHIFFSYLGYHEILPFAMFTSEVLLLTALAAFTIFIGKIGRNIFVLPFLKIMEKALYHIPVINHLYLSIKAVIFSLLHEKSPTFSEVVLVPFPDADSYALGFITRKDFKDKENKETLSVFVPGTPNPTTGFMLHFFPEEITFLDMEVSKGIKFIVSCGVIYEK